MKPTLHETERKHLKLSTSDPYFHLFKTVVDKTSCSYVGITQGKFNASKDASVISDF